MNLKRRLIRLESVPIPRRKTQVEVFNSEAGMAHDWARANLEKIKAERAADPVGSEQRRQARLVAMGFEPGYEPTWQEVLQRIIDQRDSKH